MKVIRKCAAWVLVVAVGLVPKLGSQTADDEGSDPVLEYYRAKAERAFIQSLPDQDYALKATTYYKTFGSNGRFGMRDSVTGRYYFSAGGLDSQVISTAGGDLPKPVSFEYPNVFAGSYRFFFFPNDTGGSEIAIGFDTDIFDADIFDADTAGNALPDGFAIIGRHDGYLRRLYLYYPSENRLRRYSRLISFVRREDNIFPDSVRTIRARSGIFSTEYYSLETGVSEFITDR